MKKITSLIIVALIGGFFSLTMYTYLIENDRKVVYELANPIAENPSSTPIQAVNYNTAAAAGIDFTQAAERTVNGVVHVSNVRLGRQPRNLMEMFRGNVPPEEYQAGTGSGVIITPDGYIVTNNHVIEGASKLKVTLNNNQTYEAEVIGTEPNADIALLKVDTDSELPYIPFGDSDATKVGEWALAVGNPFNLTSTVTAGIISAKARDFNPGDRINQSFLQTDAAINPGNSGGALVNINGELIGINTAITSYTGSYVGYAFAVPSNNARKIIEDILEFGSVQKGILGIQGRAINPEYIEQLEINTSETEGFHVNGLEYGGGAEKAGIKEGDIIKSIDDIKISKFSDLSGYLDSKSPNDIVQVKINRNGDEQIIPVTLIKPLSFQIDKLGIEVKNATSLDLRSNGVDNGVVIIDLLTPEMKQYKGLLGRVITELDDKEINTIEDVQFILAKKDSGDPLSFVFIDPKGERNRFVFD